MAYYRLNGSLNSSADYEPIKEDFWFGTPVSRLGPQIPYIIEVEGGGNNSSKSSYCNYKYEITFYSYGQKRSLINNGVSFPSKYYIEEYSNGKGTVHYCKFSFECISQNGKHIQVWVRTGVRNSIKAILTYIDKISRIENIEEKSQYEFDAYPYWESNNIMQIPGI